MVVEYFSFCTYFSSICVVLFLYACAKLFLRRKYEERTTSINKRKKRMRCERAGGTWTRCVPVDMADKKFEKTCSVVVVWFVLIIFFTNLKFCFDILLATVDYNFCIFFTCRNIFGWDMSRKPQSSSYVKNLTLMVWQQTTVAENCTTITVSIYLILFASWFALA